LPAKLHLRTHIIMFWGLIMEPKNKYSRTVKDEFCITMAAVDPSAKPGEKAIVYLGHEKEEHVLCTLVAGSVDQCRLDLQFTEGETISLRTESSYKVHLTGYIMVPQADDELDELDIDDEEDTDEEDEDFDGEEGDSDAEAEDDSEEDDSEEDDSEDGEDDAEAAAAAAAAAAAKEAAAKKLAKKEKKRKADEPEAEPPTKKEKKDEKKKKKKEAADTAAAAAAKEAATAAAATAAAGPKEYEVNGVKITEYKEGTGKTAKHKSKVTVKYRGWTTSNGKQFDKGKIDFRCGAGEVITGWDLGVKGMKVGGQRRLVIPSKHGYGKAGSPPEIPPHATLSFDVQLLGVA